MGNRKIPQSIKVFSPVLLRVEMTPRKKKGKWTAKWSFLGDRGKAPPPQAYDRGKAPQAMTVFSAVGTLPSVPHWLSQRPVCSHLTGCLK